MRLIQQSDATLRLVWIPPPPPPPPHAVVEMEGGRVTEKRLKS